MTTEPLTPNQIRNTTSIILTQASADVPDWGLIAMMAENIKNAAVAHLAPAPDKRAPHEIVRDALIAVEAGDISNDEARALLDVLISWQRMNQMGRTWSCSFEEFATSVKSSYDAI